MRLEGNLPRRGRSRGAPEDVQNNRSLIELLHGGDGQIGALLFPKVSGIHKADGLGVAAGQGSASRGGHTRAVHYETVLIHSGRDKAIPHVGTRRDQVIASGKRSLPNLMAHGEGKPRDYSQSLGVTAATSKATVWPLAGPSIRQMKMGAGAQSKEVVEGHHDLGAEIGGYIHEFGRQPVEAMDVDHLRLKLPQYALKLPYDRRHPPYQGTRDGAVLDKVGGIGCLARHRMDPKVHSPRHQQLRQLAEMAVESSAGNWGEGIGEKQNSHRLRQGTQVMARQSAYTADRAMHSPPQLAAVIVSRNSGQDLLDCIASLRRELRAEGTTGEIVVVDNASAEGCLEGLERGSDLHVLRNRTNRGYGVAANQGVRRTSAPRILLLNADTRLEEGAVGALMRCLDVHPEAAVAAPALVLPDGRLQDSPRRFYTLSSVLAQRTPLGGTAWGLRQRSLHRMADCNLEDSCAVDWATGAALLLRRSDIPTTGPFDPRYFLYFEDVDLCRRLSASDRRVRFCPEARVHHRFGGGSRLQLPWNPLFLNHLLSGLRFAIRWSELWWKTAALRRTLARLLELAPRLVPVFLATGLLAGTLGDSLRAPMGWAVLASALVLVLGRLPQLGRRLVHGGRLPLGTALVAGSPAEIARLGARIQDQSDPPIQVVGSLDTRPPLSQQPEGRPRQHLQPPALGPWSSVVDVARKHRADRVLLVGAPWELTPLSEEIQALSRQGVEAEYVLFADAELLRNPPRQELAGLPLFRLGSARLETLLQSLPNPPPWQDSGAVESSEVRRKS